MGHMGIFLQFKPRARSILPVPLRRSGNPLHLRVRVWRGRVGLGLVASLSVLAGMTDAIGFLATGDFVSFMSGNTTRMAVAIGEGDMSMAIRLVFAVLAFIAGNALGVLLGRLSGRRALPLLLVIAGLLCTAALLPFETRVPALLAAILAMGMLNAAVEQVNGLPVGLTYVTGALSRFGRGLGRWMLGERLAGAAGALDGNVAGRGDGGSAGGALRAQSHAVQRGFCHRSGAAVVEDTPALAARLHAALGTMV